MSEQLFSTPSSAEWSQGSLYDDNGNAISVERQEVSLERKREIFLFIKDHPTWSFDVLRLRGARELKHPHYKARWERDVAKGGTTADKYKKIDDDVWQVGP